MRKTQTNPRPLVPRFAVAKGTNSTGAPAAPASSAPGPAAAPNNTPVTTTNATGAGGIGVSPEANSQAVQASKIWNVSIPAATGSTPGYLVLAATGTQFFVVIASAAVQIRVPNGQYNSFTTNSKLVLKQSFSGLEIQNTNDFPVALSLFVGWDDYSQYSFSLQNPQTANVTKATSPDPQTEEVIAIEDLSGQAFTAADGSSWIAVSRVIVLISNVDASQGLWLQGGLSGNTNAGGVLFIPAGQSLQHQSGGNFFLTINDSTSVNAAVSEIYVAIPA